MVTTLIAANTRIIAQAIEMEILSISAASYLPINPVSLLNEWPYPYSQGRNLNKTNTREENETNHINIIQVTIPLLSLGSRPGFANPYACVIANGAAVKIPKIAALSQRVPAHSSGEKMFTHVSLQGSNSFRV